MPERKDNTIKPGAKWDPETPYNQLPDLPPPVEIETRRILKQCILSRAALAELRQAALRIPNQGILINTVPLLEAQASTEIENIVTTSDRLFQYRDTEENADPATKEALRYCQALLDGYRSLAKKPLSTGTAEQVCSKIKDKAMRVRRVPGTALSAPGGKVIYTPPEGESLLREKLANWETFLHESKEIDPLIRMAVGHYQFEAIHPFTDGNGRTGRVLNNLFLIQEGLLNLPILYLSRYIIENKSEYYRLLLKVTSQGSWEEWIMFVLKGVEENAGWTTAKIEAVEDLFSHTAEFLKKELSKIYSYELVQTIFEQPYCRIQNLVERDIAERRAASRHLKQLVETGILEERKAGREKLFIHKKLLRLLTSDSNGFKTYL
jgi:Fic family protein